MATKCPELPGWVVQEDGVGYDAVRASKDLHYDLFIAELAAAVRRFSLAVAPN